MEIEMIDVTTALEIAIRIVGILATVLLLPFLKAKLGEAKFALVGKVIEAAIAAAEEAARTGLIDKNAKYDYAVKFANKFGVTFDAEAMRGLIDGTLWETLNRFKAEDQPEGAPDEVS